MLQTVARCDCRSYFAGLAIVFVVYFGLYGWLLAVSNGVPYVLDNNESFSNLWHAYNIQHFGLAKSAGLADEVFSPWPEAHPYVEPHNGNFPRFFIYALNLAGAASIESQIVVTTFSIGTLAIWFIYHYFSRIANPLFGCLVTLVLLTDYLLFAQWQVNTWRVWHAFFLFSALLCLHQLHRRRRAWLVVLALDFACLFYYELVFATFVAIATCLYAAVLYRRSPGTLLRGWASMALGALASITLLTAQRVAYFGLHDALLEARLTYLARTHSSVAGIEEQVSQFYDRHNVAFWPNFADAQPMLTLSFATRTIFHHSFELITPVFALVVLIINAGWFLSQLAQRASIRLERANVLSVRQRKDDALRRGQAHALGSSRLAWRFSWLIWWGVYAACWGAGVWTLVGIADPPRLTGLDVSPSGKPPIWLLTLGLAAVALLGVVLGRCCAAGRRLANRPSTARLALLIVMLLGVTTFVKQQHALYEQDYSPLWSLLNRWLPGWAATALVGCALVLAVQMILGIPRSKESDERLLALKGVLLYLAGLVVAFACVYYLGAGYVVTGYVTRYAPLVVFIVDVLIAVTLYSLVVLVATPLQALLAVGWRQTGRRQAVQTLGTVLLAFGVLAPTVGQWVHVQRTYLTELPPTTFNRLRQVLQRPPLKGASLVVNNYPALPAAYTDQWAYQAAGAAPVLGESGYALVLTDRLLWMADQATNPNYARPNYLLCFVPENITRLLRRLQTGQKNAGGCPDLQSLKTTVRDITPLSEVDRDRTSHDNWAIIAVDLSRPYLHLLGAEANPRVDVQFDARGTELFARARYAYGQPDGEPEAGTVTRLWQLRSDGRRLLEEHRDDPSFRLAPDLTGMLQLSVIPHTADKVGAEYFSAPERLVGPGEFGLVRDFQPNEATADGQQRSQFAGALVAIAPPAPGPLSISLRLEQPEAEEGPAMPAVELRWNGAVLPAESWRAERRGPGLYDLSAALRGDQTFGRGILEVRPSPFTHSAHGVGEEAQPRPALALDRLVVSAGSQRLTQVEVLSGGPTLEASANGPATSVTVVGAGFKPRTSIDLLWEAPDGPQLGRGTTDGGGFLPPTQIPLPAATGGSHVIYGCEPLQCANLRVDVPFDLRVSPSTVPPGGAISVSGSGFAFGELVGLAWDDATHPLPSLVEAPGGRFQTVVSVTPSAVAGTHRLLAIGQNSHLQQAVDVTVASRLSDAEPRLSVSPPVLPTGALLSVSGSGFAPNQAVALRLDQAPWATAQCDAQGRFTLSAFQFAGLQAAGHVLAADGPGGQATVTFTSAPGGMARVPNLILPPVQHPATAVFGGTFRLLGWDLEGDGSSPPAGEPLALTLHWQAMRRPSQDYTAFVHLLDASGVLVAQEDKPPLHGAAPTSAWIPTEAVSDRYILRADRAVHRPFSLEVGWYVLATGERLRLTDGGDALTLATLP